MTGTSPLNPYHPLPGRTAQPQAELGTNLGPGGRDMHRGDAKDSDPRRDDRFSKALQKAMAVQKLGTTDEVDDLPKGAAPTAPPSILSMTPQTDGQTPAPRADVASVAERIDRYIRGAEGAQSLRDGQSMVVKLPANALGVTSVTVQMRGEVLQVTIGMQAAAAAEAGMQSQLALLGQALSLRQPKHAVRVALGDESEGESRGAERQEFNPLMPKGRIG